MELEQVIVTVVFVGMVIALILFSRWIWHCTPRYIYSWDMASKLEIKPLPMPTKVCHTYNITIDVVVDRDADESFEAVNKVIDQFIQAVHNNVYKADIEIIGRSTRPYFW